MFIRISPPTPVLYVVSVLLASVLSVPSPHPHRPRSRSTPFTKVLISIHPSLALDSRNFARTSSAPQWSQLSACSETPRSTNLPFMKSSWSVVLPVFLRSRNSFPTFSMARNPTNPSTPTKPLPTVLLFKLLFCPAIHPQNLPTRSSCLMLRHYRWVLRPLVVS